MRKRDEGLCQRLRLGAEAGSLGATDTGVMWALPRNSAGRPLPGQTAREM